MLEGGKLLPIQSDQKIFPHVTPPPPDREEDLFDWARDISNSLDELNRQIVDKYNLHLDNTQAHPSAWKAMRVPRPRYYNATDGGTTVTVPASVSNPIYFVVNGQIYEASSDLTCDLSGSGVGGLDTGSVAANTPYYLYGVDNSGSIGVIASASDPDTGPTGYTYWTYIGAVATSKAAATLRAFSASNGFLMAQDDIENNSHTGDTSSNAETYNSMPVTIDKAYFWLRVVNGEVAGASSYIESTSSGNVAILLVSQANNVSNSTEGFVPIFTPQTIYLRTTNAAQRVQADLAGWQEDPARWP